MPILLYGFDESEQISVELPRFYGKPISRDNFQHYNNNCKLWNFIRSNSTSFSLYPSHSQPTW